MNKRLGIVLFDCFSTRGFDFFFVSTVVSEQWGRRASCHFALCYEELHVHRAGCVAETRFTTVASFSAPALRL